MVAETVDGALKPSCHAPRSPLPTIRRELCRACSAFLVKARRSRYGRGGPDRTMTLMHALTLLGTAGVPGALNSVAGGGSFLTFPALLFVGVPPVVANATSTVGLWPASVS